ncbi:hypothetical protein, variant [Aphanomyces invadans]|uniref:Calx-beta domain-containing protein n=1 Tax=Aphanomyces invadans TaxID=157072 RepID=A0A024UT59_9STRA|nr:hypothetical protein H310_01558 [Aphanomyces invadans]XP_008862913.1 hypothetical protein, variant [Aphanomyces invadans]ETW09107.1 hypothetical protein H310_01558 [Aphanomyces invadans]ETW09108.1 hypothetical protein, variant [Aphanomyces invadans]|eukprot:XP_008862912.1 hypothetical protein H310_01558 [Aphanomyces invadans]
MTPFLRAVRWIWIVVAVALESVHANSLIVISQPTTITAGDAFNPPPVLQLIDDAGLVLTSVNIGSVTVAIASNPSTFGQLSGVTGLSFPIVTGVATCTGLSINLVGSGYTLQFASLFHGLQTESSPFDILLGPPFKLSMYTYIGTAQGGTPFLPQPVVSIVDRGGNIVNTVNQGTVSVSILSNPVGGILTPSTSYTVWIYQGLGKFFDLKINKAGGPYVLRFRADNAVTLPGGSTFDTFPFTVSIGPAKTMLISEHPIAAFGGEAFAIQPTITLIDAGLNVLGTQANMLVVATIYSNPSKGTLLPVAETRANVIDGVASFKNLRIDAAGNNYELRFAVKTPDARGIFVETDLFIVGPSFNVYIGTLFSLAVVQPPQSAIADGQPIYKQPILELRDRGANVIVTENLALVTVSMVPSLALYNTLILSTVNPVPAAVVSVTLLPSLFTSPYGSGTDLVISVTFSQEVLATGDVQLMLNSGADATGRCTTLLTWTRTLLFTYGISVGHSTGALNYINTQSLVLVAGSINDRIGNGASIILPDPTTGGMLPVVAVDSTVPSVVSVGCGGSTVAGTYGPGQDLILAVTFSAPVAILGEPAAPVPVPTLSLNVIAPQVATYISGNQSRVLLFRYTVGLADTLTSALLDVTASVSLNGAALRRAGTTPNQVADVTMPVNVLQMLPSLCPIAIDSTVVTVDANVGITTTSAAGVYAPGDVVTIIIPFTNPVVVTGIPLLLLDTTQNAIYTSGSGTNQLTFLYTVGAGDWSLDLNYATDNSLLLNGGSIRRFVSVGRAISDVNPSLAAVTIAAKSLADQSAIVIDGRTPTIQSVVFSAAGTKTRGDSVAISITFSSDVVVSGGPPRLTLNTNRRAIYTSGSNTATLVFTYQVLLGDNTQALAYSAASALSLNGGTIRKKSAAPSLAADLSLPWPSNILNGPVVIDPNSAFITTVTGFACDLPADDYGLNQVLQISVTFSDVVQVIGSVQLSLQTQNIQYASGSGTSTLVFLYVVRANDATPSLDIASPAPFSCQGAAPCSIVNANFVAVNLDCTGLTLQPTGISISTVAPFVQSVAAITTAPTINSNCFVVGDVIDILVVASKKVHVDPSPDVFPDKVPLLSMATGRAGAVARFFGYGADRTQLIFRYIVQPGDMTPDLMYANTNSLSLNFNQATIKRLTTNPTTNMDLALPTPQTLGVGLKIDTSRTPQITNVQATTPDGTYFRGDLITIQVSYTENVVVTGQPVLKLDLGINDRDAVYTSGSGSSVLTFQYTVGQDDTSRDLRYIDVKSLFVPLGASILHRATNPTVKANNRLPNPATPGSLSFNNNIVIRGSTPYVTDISFVTVNGTYTVNSVIQISVTFTTTVTVTGAPFLELATGTVRRRAAYIAAGPDTKLVFQYRVETGDVSNKLDYASTSALNLNGGTIMTTPTLAGRPPVQPANTQLNPPGGALSGGRIIQASLGRVSYTDLGIDTMGLQYVIYFSTPPKVEASVMFNVTYSAVWEVRNSPINVQNRGDKTGWSVDVNGAVAIVGSAGTIAKRYNVQEITAWGSASTYVDEVQYVQTTCVHRDAVQLLKSSAAPGQTVGGYFSLMYGAVGPTRRLSADFDAAQLEVALELDFGLAASSVEVSRSQNTYCGCNNAYEWTITFHTQGDVPTLVARNYLTGNGATIGDGKGSASAIVVTQPPVVAGLFALRYGTMTTQNMPSNVDAATMATRLALDLNLPIRSVARSEPTIQNGYTWSITFSSSSTLFNINELQPSPVFLTGNQVLLSVTTVREGQAPLYGSFRLGLGDETTANIPVTATDVVMKAALESLRQVSRVTVARSPQNKFGGYTWTVTFVEINTPTIYGLVLSNLGTLPPLTPVTLVNNIPILLGSDAVIRVDYAGVNPSVYSSASLGNAPGESAGSATVFVPYNKQWVQSALLVGQDTRLGDQFGTSVALSLTGNQAIVGAPFAVYRGNTEQQALSCIADGGTFTLSFLGLVSAPIAFDASRTTLQTVIAALLKVNAQFITVSSYTALCSGSVILITLATPDLADSSGNIPDLVPDDSLLTSGGLKGVVSMQSVVQGSFREDGPNAKGTRCGGAYFFTSPSVGVWTQVVKMTPTDGSESLPSEFGASVSLEGSFAVVGAPGARYAKGEAYVYQFNGVQWSLYQKLTSSPYVSAQGDRFGDSVKVSDTTVVVGAPGYAGKVGAVFVFQLVNGVFINRQKLQPGDLAVGDKFGSSVAVDMQTSTIAASSKWRNQRGAVYIFYSPDLFFSLQQVVQGSDTQQDDGFGQSVAIVKNVLVVGANEHFNSNRPLTIRKAIQTITTSGSSPLGKTFRVGFRKVSDGYEEDFVYSKPIPFDATATVVQQRLQTDLNTGALVVTRQGPDANQGYSWSITFTGSTSDVPKLRVDGSALTGANAQITCTMAVAVPPIVRSNVYVFLRTGTTWQEQVTLRPTNKQYYSMFGNAVSLSRNGFHAIAGAYNADTLFSAINSGAAYLFDMAFMDFRFSSPTYSVLEGDTVSIPVQRCGALGNACIMKSTATQEFIDFDTGDAVTDMAGQNRVPAMELKYIGPFQQLCMLTVTADTPGAKYYPDVMGPEPFPLVPKGRYIMPYMIGTAHSRAQSYGSSRYRSVWVDSQYDYLGVSDYRPSSGELSFPPQTVLSTFSVSTTDDSVYEYPDETINVRLSVPGMWPTFPSQFWSQITILDNGDGGMGTTSYSTRLTGDVTTGSRLGQSVAFFDGINLAAVGAPFAKMGGVECGAVYVYNSRSGVWTLEAKLVPQSCTPGLRFGTSVAIDGSYGTVRLVVGSPGPPTPSAVVYRRSAQRVWSFEVEFSEPQAVSITDNYAGRDAVSIHGNLIVVGASGLEAAFVYTFTPTGWLPAVVLRASDYTVDQDNLLSITRMFHFGASVATNRRAIVVGAPKANYGSQRVRDVDFLSKGAAYMYYLPAQVQVVALVADSIVTAGEFTLSNGVTTTNPLSYQISAADMVSVLKALVPDVEVSRTGDIVRGFEWRVTFISEVTNQPLLVPAWRGNGCAICIAFSSGFAANPTRQVSVVETVLLGTWTFQTQLTASDGNQADRFGHSVALDGNAVIVGAYTSSALTTTTWNFETGDLTGWIKTGTAFDAQPTFGDNVMARGDSYKSYETAKGTIQHEGRYWIGTFESRPGAGVSQRASPFTCAFANADCRTTKYSEPGTAIAGTSQGDDPQGTLSSQVFTIMGSRMSFRLGGGCNLATIYVELLVDGVSVRRETGRCDEKMRLVTWNVTRHRGKSAIVRIVDASSTDLWGHINVDDFQFDWAVEQSSTSTAGVAYAFQRQATLASFSPCAGIPKLQCFWVLQSRLVASDKRPQDEFGFSVAVDDSVGTAVIGAYHQPGVNLNNSIVLPENTGSIYLFSRIDAIRDGAGNVLAPPKWLARETAKFQSSDKSPGAQWGYAVSLNGPRLAVGSPGFGGDTGCGYVYDTRFLQVSFASPEVGVLENVVSGQVIVVVLRTGDLSQPLTIGYATSDSSAVGIDSTWFAACLGMMIQNRVRCGDYLQTRGELTFNIGESNKVIAVSIMDDWCYEQYPKYISLRLNVLGGDVLLGEQFAMVIRIDDDDFGRDPC